MEVPADEGVVVVGLGEEPFGNRGLGNGYTTLEKGDSPLQLRIAVYTWKYVDCFLFYKVTHLFVDRVGMT